jgi:hypothetical protein
MKTKLLFLAFIPLLFLSGCGESTPKEDLAENQIVERPIIKQPKDIDPIETAINTCQEDSYSISLVFDEIMQKTSAYCVFTNSTACDVVSYARGSCTTETALPFNPIGENKDGNKVYRFCDTSSQPVCGIDAITYSNPCIAEVQEKEIAHEGPCNESLDGANIIPKSRIEYEKKVAIKTATTKKRTSPNAKSYTVPTDSERDWFSIMLDIADSEKESYKNNFIEECTISGKYYYFKSTGETNPFSILYDDSGSVICFPNNDVNTFCPKNFSATKRTGCTRIWP